MNPFDDPGTSTAPKRGRGRPRKAVEGQQAPKRQEDVTPAPGLSPSDGRSGAEAGQDNAEAAAQTSLGTMSQRPAAGSQPPGTGGYIPTATLLGVDRPSTSSTSAHPLIINPPPRHRTASRDPGGGLGTHRTAIADRVLHPIPKGGAPSQNGQPGLQLATSPLADGPVSAQNAVAIRPVEPGSKKAPELPAGIDDGPHMPESDDSSIPGMDYNPPIPTGPIMTEADGRAGGAAQQPSGGGVGPAREQAAQGTPTKDRFSLSDLEAALARMMRPRTAETGKPADAQRIARSGTFVWDVEKLGPPRRKRTDIRPGGAFTSTSLPPFQSGTPVGNTGIVPIDQTAVQTIAAPRQPDGPAIVIAPEEKRRRGRPRKDPAIAAPPIKRKRGRPRKDPVVPVAEASVKRPRGRPRKARPDPAAVPPIKRKRGRPRKNATGLVQGPTASPGG